MSEPAQLFEPGTRVTVTHQIPFGSRLVTQKVTGTVVSYGQAKTGSWFAHGKNDRLWLDRLTLKMDDGETVVLNLDQFSRVDPAEAAEAQV